MEIETNTAKLSFKSIQGDDTIKLSSFGAKLTGFTIAGKDKIFYPANATINRNGTISVHSIKVPEPVAVRYGFEDCFNASLYDLAKIPVSPFRTVSW
jgi:sialate O-acetylesterase